MKNKNLTQNRLVVARGRVALCTARDTICFNLNGSLTPYDAWSTFPSHSPPLPSQASLTVPCCEESLPFALGHKPTRFLNPTFPHVGLFVNTVDVVVTPALSSSTEAVELHLLHLQSTSIIPL